MNDYVVPLSVSALLIAICLYLHFNVLRVAAQWTCNGLVPVACLSLCHLSFESQGAYAAQI